MRVLPLHLLGLLGASAVGACSVVESPSAALDKCEKALAVLIRTGPNSAEYSIDRESRALASFDLAVRRIGLIAKTRASRQRARPVFLAYHQNNTQKLATCFYKPGVSLAIGYEFEGRRLSDAETAAINRQL